MKVKLISGIIYNKDFFNTERYVDIVENKLIENFAEIDLRSEIIPFDFTTYYAEEMDKNLLRYWISFADLIQPDQIADIKNKTRKIEKDFSLNSDRRINIDPGYITDSKLVLVSTKNFSHRIYLKDAIFAEVTLMFKDKKFQALPWTYPDYKIEIAHTFFTQVRTIYLNPYY